MQTVSEYSVSIKAAYYCMYTRDYIDSYMVE